MTTVAIIGAGFSGTLLALHLLRNSPRDTTVILCERHAQFGPGAAYATGNPNHLLNVPAGRMSAFHDRPQDFLDWLRSPEAPAGADATTSTESCFVPRRFFGAYIRSLLLQEIKRPANAGRLKLVRGRVTALTEQAQGLTLELTRKRRIAADFAILATGNFPPEPPAGADPALLASAHYSADPWAADAFDGLDPDAPVLLIGTGLTMVDSVIELLDRCHRGPIHALSRRGLLPRRHATDPGDPGAMIRRQSYPTELTKLTRLLREDCAQVEAGGGCWQSVIDQIRPFTLDAWLKLSHLDRKRFLRHLRRWWDVHRHRMAPDVADRIDQAQAERQLNLHVGRIDTLTPNGAGARLIYRSRTSGEKVTLDVARVVNCAGPGCDFERIDDALIQSMLRAGTVRPDRLHLGLDVTAHCALKNRDGSISSRLFAIGPVTKGAFWEMTAVPDIRRQCEFLAKHLGSLVATPPPSGHPAVKDIASV
jgi:uncharacterized NAD(P)/FAD-binding protein YdhS